MKKIVILVFVAALAVGAVVVGRRVWEDRFHEMPLPDPVSRERFLDPYTRVYQTDDPEEGKRLAAEPGYWPVPQGLHDPAAEWKKLKPRVVHAVFRVQDEPFPDYDPAKPSPLFKVNQVGYLPDAPKFAYVGA